MLWKWVSSLSSLTQCSCKSSAVLLMSEVSLWQCSCWECKHHLTDCLSEAEVVKLVQFTKSDHFVFLLSLASFWIFNCFIFALVWSHACKTVSAGSHLLSCTCPVLDTFRKGHIKQKGILTEGNGGKKGIIEEFPWGMQWHEKKLELPGTHHHWLSWATALRSGSVDYHKALLREEDVNLIWREEANSSEK